MIIHIFILSILFIEGSFEWYGNNGYGNNPYGQPPPLVPNNNVAIGYPTAYGLWLGRGGGGGGGWGWNNGYNGGGAPPNSGTGFGSPLRCLNGGAHIGQCRLDNDAICVALGGGCIHGACCTTPFLALLTSTTSSVIVDGEVTRKREHTTIEPETEKPRKKRPKTTTTTTTTTTTEEPTTTEESVTQGGVDVIDAEEIEEWNRLVEIARSTINQRVTVTMRPEEGEIEISSQQCSSGLRAVGPCIDDDDCPSLHNCEKAKCCYNVY